MLSGYSTHSNPHIPAGFRESRVTPVDSNWLPSKCLSPGALLRVQLGRWTDLGVLEEGLEGCGCLGWPDNQETLDSLCLVTLHTCSEGLCLWGMRWIFWDVRIDLVKHSHNRTQHMVSPGWMPIEECHPQSGLEHHISKAENWNKRCFKYRNLKSLEQTTHPKYLKAKDPLTLSKGAFETISYPKQSDRDFSLIAFLILPNVIRTEFNYFYDLQSKS